jgi:pimeloyl-ACP methyl ester carboxylesterase
MASVAHGGADIHYDLVDQRVPWQRPSSDDVIVFHHGLGACADVWRGWDHAVADRYRLLRLDMRGHGRSKVPEEYSWSIDALADDLEAVVDHAELGRFHLVGESIGGTTALAFAARHPHRLESLTVCNGAHRGENIRNLSPWKQIIDEGGMTAWSAHMMKMRFHDGALSEERWRWYETQQATCDPDCVLPAAAALIGADLTANLSDIRMPTLVLHPDASPFIPVGVMGELNESLPDSRLRVVAHSRHGLPYSHARECAAEFRTFLGS